MASGLSKLFAINTWTKEEGRRRKDKRRKKGTERPEKSSRNQYE
jgi:hypothetical protein